jgi:hypothetical protein
LTAESFFFKNIIKNLFKIDVVEHVPPRHPAIHQAETIHAPPTIQPIPAKFIPLLLFKPVEK